MDTQNQTKTFSFQSDKNMSIASSVGFLGGLFYAFKNQKGFWGYVGFGILGSIVASTLYKIVAPKKDDVKITVKDAKTGSGAVISTTSDALATPKVASQIKQEVSAVASPTSNARMTSQPPAPTLSEAMQKRNIFFELADTTVKAATKSDEDYGFSMLLMGGLRKKQKQAPESKLQEVFKDVSIKELQDALTLAKQAEANKNDEKLQQRLQEVTESISNRLGDFTTLNA